MADVFLNLIKTKPTDPRSSIKPKQKIHKVQPSHIITTGLQTDDKEEKVEAAREGMGRERTNSLHRKEQR